MIGIIAEASIQGLKVRQPRAGGCFLKAEGLDEALCGDGNMIFLSFGGFVEGVSAC